MSLTERICGLLTGHRHAIHADGGYRICKICGKIYKIKEETK